MENRTETTPGDLVKIPFSKGVHTYARILEDGSYAIYDCRSIIERHDYSDIIKSDILFVAQVDVFGVKEGYWSIVQNIPLAGVLRGFYPRYFVPAPTNPSNVSFYNVHKSEIEDATDKDWIKTGKMQLGGMHNRVNVEGRIKDYYDGIRHGWNLAIISVFKKYLGLTL